jgi:hypothetical protein
VHYVRFFPVGGEIARFVFGQAGIHGSEDLSVLATGEELLAGLGRARSGAWDRFQIFLLNEGLFNRCIGQYSPVKIAKDIFINLKLQVKCVMDVVEAIYEEGNLRVLDPSKIDSELITVKILNIEEVLSDDEEILLKEALNDREKGKYHTFDEVFG